jgi:hypothetical protein
MQITKHPSNAYAMFRGAGKLIIGGGGQIFIYSCSQTVKTIAFKGNK